MNKEGWSISHPTLALHLKRLRKKGGKILWANGAYSVKTQEVATVEGVILDAFERTSRILRSYEQVLRSQADDPGAMIETTLSLAIANFVEALYYSLIDRRTVEARVAAFILSEERMLTSLIVALWDNPVGTETVKKIFEEQEKDRRDKEVVSEDVFLQHLSDDLRPLGKAMLESYRDMGWRSHTVVEWLDEIVKVGKARTKFEKRLGREVKDEELARFTNALLRDGQKEHEAVKMQGANR